MAFPINGLSHQWPFPSMAFPINGNDVVCALFGFAFFMIERCDDIAHPLNNDVEDVE